MNGIRRRNAFPFRSRQHQRPRLIALGLLGATLMVEGACTTSIVTGPPPRGFLTHPEASLALLKARLPALMDSGGVPGMSVALISAGRLLWTQGLGVRKAGDTAGVDENTVFEAASLSKPVLAYAALRLVDQGRLDPDRPLAEYLPHPDLRDSRALGITARNVLSHTTGLQNERIGADTLAFAFTPGEAFRYSGEAYTYLGTVIAKIAGTPFNDAMRTLVFEPLGMARSSYVWDPRLELNSAVGHGAYQEARTPMRPSAARAASTLQTSAHDYARFLLAVLNGEGLHPATRALMLAPQVDAAPEIHWGLGWSLTRQAGGLLIWHHGDNSLSGFTAYAMADPTTKTGFVYFANSTTGLGFVREVLDVLGGTHTTAEWINHERYNSPVRLARIALERVAVEKGAAFALEEYTRMRRTRPPDAFREGLLNSLGYRMLQLGRPADAVILFEHNAREYPESANVYDSLGDGLAAAGARDAAIEAYERSLRLDPMNSHAATAIEELRRKP